MRFVSRTFATCATERKTYFANVPDATWSFWASGGISHIVGFPDATWFSGMPGVSQEISLDV